MTNRRTYTAEFKRDAVRLVRMLVHSGPPRSIHVATCAELTWPPALGLSGHLSAGVAPLLRSSG